MCKQRGKLDDMEDNNKQLFPEYVDGGTTDPPGALREAGKRHDNDHQNVQDIHVTPTEGELLCNIAPYLPENRAGTVAHLPIGSIEAHRDLHFRLLRHDLVQQIQLAISDFRLWGGIKKSKEIDSLGESRHRKGAKDATDVDLDIYHNVSIINIAAKCWSGPIYEIEFDRPNWMLSKKKEYREIWWSKSKKLTQNTFVCLFWEEDGDPKSPRIVPGIVSERDSELLAKHRARISISLPHNPVNRMLTEAAIGRNPFKGNEIVMLQAGPSLFGYQHVLKALKTVAIPFSQYITAPPCEKEQVPKMGQPAYLDRQPTFDMSFLATNRECLSVLDRERLRYVDLSNPDNFPMTILAKASTMDKSQLEAIKTGLTNEIALIQGPPGTGKTYVGVQIIRLLENVRSKGVPILCVCCTNHAVDQFLLDIIDHGITNVIRIGGRVRSPRLDAYNLKPMLRDGGSDSDKRLKRKNRWELGKVEDDIRGLKERAREVSRGEINWTDIHEIVMTESASFINAISAEGDLTETWKSWSSGSSLWQHREGISSSPQISLCDVAYEMSAYSDDVFPVCDALDGNNTDEEVASSSVEGNGAPRQWKDNFSQLGVSLEDMETRGRPLTRILDCPDIWSMTRIERAKLIEHWRKALLNNLIEKLNSKIKEYEDLREEMSNIKDNIALSILEKVSVVGMTTSGVAMHQSLITHLAPKVVVIEEAAEVLEAHILTSLSSGTEHLILIGDHEQLRPKPNLYELQIESGRGFNLDLSLFERLVRQGSVPVTTLEVQRRMNPDISRLIKSTIYPQLKNHKTVHSYPEHIPGMKRKLFFLDHDHSERGEESKSKTNNFESKFCVRLAKYLMQQGCYKSGDITIITPYAGQLRKLKKEMKKLKLKSLLDEKDEDILNQLIEDSDEDASSSESFGAEFYKSKDGAENTARTQPSRSSIAMDVALKDYVRIATVDNFQGEESKVIIISLVRNNKKGQIGFLGTKNRGNVLLSRAKHAMYILGNAASLKAARGEFWKSILKMLEETGSIGRHLELFCQNHPGQGTKISQWQDFDIHAGDGGCGLPCGHRLPNCGHICPRRCHLDDRDHVETRCEVLYDIPLPCGHTAVNQPCHRAEKAESIYCHETVGVVPYACSFNHINTVKCSESQRFREDPESCNAKITVGMPLCGHSIEIRCGERARYLKDPRCCSAKCADFLQCGHICNNKCGSCISLTMAAVPDALGSVEETMRMLELQMPGVYQTSDYRRAFGDARSTLRKEKQHHPCRESCGEQHLCGHLCGQPCHKGTNCGPCKKVCSTQCTHSHCRKWCSDPCTPCLETCPWECAHKARCSLPCGAPCNRLPCDRRCEKKLECGCQCPCVCGEPCPTSDYCIKHASPKVKEQLIDVEDSRYFSDITEEDVNNNPLLVLQCGHAWTMSTLDRVMELERFYERGPGNDGWVRALPPPPEVQGAKCCMKCWEPISGVFRYGRRLNKVTLELNEVKFMSQCRQSLAQCKAGLGRLEKDAVEKLKHSALLTTEGIDRIKLEARNVAKMYIQLGIESQRPPKVQLCAITQAAIERAARLGEWTKGVKAQHRQALAIPPPDFSNYVSSLIGFGKCAILWMESQICRLHRVILEAAEEDRGYGNRPRTAQEILKQDECSQKIRKLVEGGDKTYDTTREKLEKAINKASTGFSISKQVQASTVLMCLMIQKHRLLGELKIHRALVALRTISLENDKQQVEIQNKLVREALEVGCRAKQLMKHQWGCNARNDPEYRQIVDIYKRVKALNSGHELSKDDIFKIVSSFVEKDAIIDYNVGKGHLYTCPNGHIRLIEECERAMETYICPECRATIGGQHHQLDVDNDSDSLLSQMLRILRLHD